MKSLVRTLGLMTITSLLAAGMVLAAPADTSTTAPRGGAKMSTKGGKMAGHKGSKSHKGGKKGAKSHKGGKMGKKGGSSKGASTTKKGM
jgi:hypothetical protein